MVISGAPESHDSKQICEGAKHLIEVALPNVGLPGCQQRMAGVCSRLLQAPKPHSASLTLPLTLSWVWTGHPSSPITTCARRLARYLCTFPPTSS